MRACVTTFCTWTSLGSILQALGLKTALLSLGCESFLVQPERITPCRLLPPRSLKEAVSFPFDCLNHKNRKTAYLRSSSFIRDNLDVRDCPDYSAICAAPPEADIYITGSDQVWQPFRMNPLFFLDFVKNAKKISYAASMGSTAVSEDAARLFRSYLKDFAAVSVREQACAEVISPYTDLPVNVNIDPTFYLNKEEWRSYAKAYPVKEPYILLYTIYWSDEMKDHLRQLSKQTGLPIYAVKTGLSRAYADRALYDVGPAEFLWLIDHASYVVTSSFHGAAFSTIFHKQFSAVINPKAPSRIESLLNVLDIPRPGIEELDTHAPFDYAVIDKNIAAETERGIAYLRGALR